MEKMLILIFKDFLMTKKQDLSVQYIFVCHAPRLQPENLNFGSQKFGPI
jgi:hypothetical protein